MRIESASTSVQYVGCTVHDGEFANVTAERVILFECATSKKTRPLPKTY